MKKSSLKSEKTFLHNQLKSTSNQRTEHKSTKSFFIVMTMKCHLKTNCCTANKTDAKRHNQNLHSQLCHTGIYKRNANTLMHNMEPFNKVTRILFEQNADPVLLIFQNQMLGLLFLNKSQQLIPDTLTIA